MDLQTPQFTADDWQLYTSEPGHEEAARTLNAALGLAIRGVLTEGHDIKAAMDSMKDAFKATADFGSRDSEPMGFAVQHLRRAYIAASLLNAVQVVGPVVEGALPGMTAGQWWRDRQSVRESMRWSI
jgi:hypothetical protein